MSRAHGAFVVITLIACSRPSEPRRSDGADRPAPGPTAVAPQAPAPAPATASTATPAPASTAAAAAPSGPIPLPVTSAAAVAGGVTSPLSFNEPTTVDPASRFHVEAAVSVIDARLSLVDADDAMIAAAESHEIGATWSRFTLVADAPLRPGARYVLRLDGAAEREAHDSNGRAYQITTWPIRVAGEAPPPEKPAHKGKRR